MLRTALAFCLVFAQVALAEDDLLKPVPNKPAPVDDLLAPVPKSKPAAKPKAKPKPKPAEPAAAAPTPPPPPVAAPTPSEDELLAPVAKGEVLVKLTAAVKGAQVIADGEDLGQLTGTAKTINLPVGAHSVTVKRAGFAPVTQKVTVAVGKPKELSFTLEPTMAVFSVASDVVGAQVFVNGKPVGVAPIDELEVSPGNVEFAVRKEGFVDNVQTIAARAGRDYPIKVRMQKVPPPDVPPATASVAPSSSAGQNPLTATAEMESSPIYSRWYFWAGAAAVVAAGVTTAVVLSQGGEPARVRACKGITGCSVWDPSTGTVTKALSTSF